MITNYCCDILLYALSLKDLLYELRQLYLFFQEYSTFCGVANTHHFPGPRLGPQNGQQPGGNVGVMGNFGFGIGIVPGLDVSAGWGVDVGPMPWIPGNIGFGSNTGVSVLNGGFPQKVFIYFSCFRSYMLLVLGILIQQYTVGLTHTKMCLRSTMIGFRLEEQNALGSFTVAG